MRTVRKFFADSDGKLVIWQWPNIPLWGFIVFRAAAYLLHTGRVRHGFELVGTTFLAIWAYLEITAGDSPFRRVLGTVVAVLIVVGFFM